MKVKQAIRALRDQAGEVLDQLNEIEAGLSQGNKERVKAAQSALGDCLSPVSHKFSLGDVDISTAIMEATLCEG